MSRIPVSRQPSTGIVNHRLVITRLATVLLTPRVTGCNRVPEPPARMIPFSDTWVLRLASSCRVHVTVLVVPRWGLIRQHIPDCTIIASVHAPHTESSPTPCHAPNFCVSVFRPHRQHSAASRLCPCVRSSAAPISARFKRGTLIEQWTVGTMAPDHPRPQRQGPIRIEQRRTLVSPVTSSGAGPPPWISAPGPARTAHAPVYEFAHVCPAIDTPASGPRHLCKGPLARSPVPLRPRRSSDRKKDGNVFRNERAMAVSGSV